MYQFNVSSILEAGTKLLPRDVFHRQQRHMSDPPCPPKLKTTKSPVVQTEL